MTTSTRVLLPDVPHDSAHGDTLVLLPRCSLCGQCSSASADGRAHDGGEAARPQPRWPARRWAASTMTRTSGSVPLGRSSTRPLLAQLGLGLGHRSGRPSPVRRPATGRRRRTLTSTWGSRCMTAARSASVRPVPATRASRCRRREQPVAGRGVVGHDARGRTARRRGCTRPRASPRARSGRRRRSATTAMPSRSHRQPEAEVGHHGGDHACRAPGAGARACARARIARIWSPSTSWPACVHGQAAVGVAVEGDAEVGAVLDARPRCSDSRWVEPQPSLMFSPSGASWIATTSAPAAANASGATTEAAPLAQSTTTCSPSRRLAASVDEQVRDVRRRRLGDRRSTRPTPAPVGRSHGSPQPGLDGVLDGVVELVSAAGEELDPVVGHRVVRRRQHDAEVGAQRGRQVGDGRASGSTPTRTTSTPALASPATTAASRNSPDGPGVTPDDGHADGDPRTRPPRRARGRPRREVDSQLGGEVAVGEATDAVGAEEPGHRTSACACPASRRPTGRMRATRAVRVSACCTAEPCGPS